MPIADMDGYKSGHFDRVYKYLIKRACEKAGYEPVRADEEQSSNLIVMDILKKIVESDMVLCDMSGRNANVFYELGIRQAFNKATVLIKDKKTPRIFDTSSLRDYEYDESLRIDSVEDDITAIAAAISKTENSSGDVNSLIQLLSIEPAQITNEKIQLTTDSSVLLDAINSLRGEFEEISHGKKTENSKFYLINGDWYSLGSEIYGDEVWGEILSVDNKCVLVKKSNGNVAPVKLGSKEYNSLAPIPF